MPIGFSPTGTFFVQFFSVLFSFSASPTAYSWSHPRWWQVRLIQQSQSEAKFSKCPFS